MLTTDCLYCVKLVLFTRTRAFFTQMMPLPQPQFTQMPLETETKKSGLWVRKRQKSSPGCFWQSERLRAPLESVTLLKENHRFSIHHKTAKCLTILWQTLLHITLIVHVAIR